MMSSDEIKGIIEELRTYLSINEEELLNIIDSYIVKLERENKDYKNRIGKSLKMIFDNYGVLDKYEIEMLDDTLRGKNNE